MSIDGLRAICFILIVVYFANFLNKDMVQRNRWREVYMYSLSPPLYVMITITYIFLDYLFMFSAFLQANKLFKFFKSVPESQDPCSWCKFTFTYMEIVLLRAVRFVPAIALVMVAVYSMVNFVGDGATWFEIGNMYDCKDNWWTPLVFINEIVPFYTKDYRGCMRYTAPISIEMKLFLFLPITIKLYSMGLKKTVVMS